ncbi:MAG: hypothetical protein JRF41_01210, partial [Deltaproteobacteria bacterium]|nr:hypothetical protein [Deltaproteobacteria bacterium]
MLEHQKLRLLTVCCKKKFLLGLTLVSFVLLSSVLLVQAASGEPEIKDIVVCNVYWEDFKAMNLPYPRVSKFVVTFGSAVSPDLMESISVKGPDGYTYDINLERYTTKNLNGYVGTGNGIWFMGYDRRGFLKDGRYDITLKYKSGRITRKGRVMKYSSEILDAYLKIKPEFSPTGHLPAGADLSGITLKWTVAPGIKAHYMTRIGTNRGSGNNWTKNFGWIFQDTIFGYGTGNPYNRGINKGELKVDKTLKPGQWYLWFTEILDSDDFNKINIAIFCKYQYLITA